MASERDDLIEELRAVAEDRHGAKNTHLLSWLEKGYFHCQHGGEKWCQGDYLDSAKAYIERLEAISKDALATISRLEAEVEAGEPVALLYEWTDRSGATQQGLCFNTPSDRVTKVNDQPPRYVGGLYARPVAEVKAWLLGDPATGQWVEVDGHRVEYSRGVGTPSVALAEAFKAERSRADAAERERNIARFERDDARKALGTVRAALKAWDDCPDHAFQSTVMEKAAGLAEAVRAALAPPRTEGERG